MSTPNLVFKFCYFSVGKTTLSFNVVPRKFSFWENGFEMVVF